MFLPFLPYCPPCLVGGALLSEHGTTIPYLGYLHLVHTPLSMLKTVRRLPVPCWLFSFLLSYHKGRGITWNNQINQKLFFGFYHIFYSVICPKSVLNSPFQQYKDAGITWNNQIINYANVLLICRQYDILTFFLSPNKLTINQLSNLINTNRTIGPTNAPTNEPYKHLGTFLSPLSSHHTDQHYVKQGQRRQHTKRDTTTGSR